MMRKLQILICCAAVVVVVACGTKGKQPLEVKAEGAVFAADAVRGPAVTRGGLTFRLEEGKSPHGAADRNPVDPGKALSEGDTNALLARLQPLTAKAGDQTDFAFRPRSLPAPRTGKTIKTVFPPPEKPAAVKPADKGPLTVLRQSPNGPVKMAPKLSVTFSQPMVAVTSHADTIAKGVPVKLTPELKGQWRWIGTRTLLFETKLRFPMATEFTAEVPAGTRSATGGVLAEAKRWTFSTPAPRLIQRYPSGGPQRLDPVFFLGFDQQIDPDAVLVTVKLEGGGKVIPVLRATQGRIDGDKVVAAYVKASMAAKHKSRFVAFVATERLQPATSYKVTVGPGTPSVEGPRKTEEAQTFDLRTYEPLKLEWANCQLTRACRPPGSLMMRFNNELDEKSIDAKQISVEPKIPDMQVVVRHRYISIYGRTKGMTTYIVKVPAALKDMFGQTLGKPESRAFVFKEALPQLLSNYKNMVVLDPKGDKSFNVHSINHKQLRVKIWKVKPTDWHDYLTYVRKFRWHRDKVTMPGTLHSTEILKVKGSTDEMVETVIPLKKALNKAGHGQVVVQVSQWPLPEKRYERQWAIAWLQATDLAVDAFVDYTHLHGWVTRLADGKAVSGAQVLILPAASLGTSGADGLSKIELPEISKKSVLVAKTKDDLVMLPENKYYWGSSYWYKRTPPGEQLRWFVFDDRKLYKPKEEVRLKGWVRVVDMGRSGRIQVTPVAGKTITYTVFGPRGNKVANGTAEINAAGGFHLQFKLPDTVNLGDARVTLSSSAGYGGNYYTHRFQIQEFKRPEFEVNATASPGPFVIPSKADIAVKAAYFAGGGLPGAKVQWRVTANKGHFTPPNRSGWTFVGWTPSWGRQTSVKSNTESFDGVTDSRGEHKLRIHFDSVDPARPMSVNAAATITDVNRRTWTATKLLLVHPSSLYVGLKTKKYFVRRGTPLKVQVIVTDLKGIAVSGRIVGLQAVRQEWRYLKSKWTRVERDPQNCRVISKKDAVSCTFKTDKGGSYILRARVTDDKGRSNRTVMTRWVSGGKLPPKHVVEKEQVRLIAGQTKYQPGDTAEILVQAPFFPAEGLMTVRQAGIAVTRRFHMKESTTLLKVAIKERHYPSLSVQVDLVGAAARLDKDGEPVAKLPKRPAFASGSLSLNVPPLKRELKVTATARAPRLEPGGKTVIDVALWDADGKPVAGAEVALVAVDEAVLALTGYKLYSPLSAFHPYRYGGVRDYYLRDAVRLMDPTKLAEGLRTDNSPGGRPAAQRALTKSSAELSVSGAMDSAARPAPPSPARRRSARGRAEKKEYKAKGKRDASSEPTTKIAVRRNFTPLALYSPTVQTDGSGKAAVPIKLPDNLTRYRVMAVAVSGATRYGYGESTVQARKPLMLRPAAPRFLNYGDRFWLPIVVQNQTDTELKVKVAVRGTNVTWSGGQGKLITVPANNRREVRFGAETVKAGIARFQIGASSGRFADAAEIKLPVWTPATTEAFATYGTIDQGAESQPVMMPKGVIKAFGGLDVSTSSTALHALTDAVLYIYSYPYECSEQISSRVLAVSALKDVLSAFKAKGLPKGPAIAEAVARDMRKLNNMQNDDGGFPFWRRYRKSWPFLSLHVTHALVRARQKGFPVPGRMYASALQHIKYIERYIPWYYGEHIRRVIAAYSVYVRALAGDADVDKALTTYRWFQTQKSEALEAIGWLYPVLSGAPTPGAKAAIREIRTTLANRVTETAGAAHFRTSYADGAHLILYSDRRVDGLLLEGLIKDQPKADLIPKIVRGLLAHRKRGRWGNTQENVWVLLALDKYFNTYEKVTPNFVARVWLGERFAGQHRFAGRTTDRHAMAIPMRLLGEPGQKHDLVIDKQGPGRLYYRIGMRYAPADLRPPPANHGFTVQRRYEAVDNPKDVTRDPDGTWRVKAGARVRVVVTMVAHARRYHVALVDPLPAGLEAINTTLKGAEPEPPTKRGSTFTRSGRYGHMGKRGRSSSRHRGYYWGWWRRAWYEHQNLRDERAEAFTSLLWAGVHVYKYVCRALTPGTFVVPPAKAEEMYHPETFGRSAGDRLIVQ
ncbi:MAG: alpha-2-macroglobulin family protein [bacterium]